MSDSHPWFSLKAVPSLNTRWVLGGTAAAAVAGTLIYSIWEGAVGLFLARLYVLLPYLVPPYLFLYLLAPTKKASAVALADRVCATLAALGLLVPWGWYVTIPLTPQNAQAPIGLFMMGWTGAVGFYSTAKLAMYVFRMGGDDSR